jgi:hypothetical protein
MWQSLLSASYAICDRSPSGIVTFGRQLKQMIGAQTSSSTSPSASSRPDALGAARPVQLVARLVVHERLVGDPAQRGQGRASRLASRPA